jgi:hypothetical protein
MANETITRRLDYVTELRYGAGTEDEVIRAPQPDVIAAQDPAHTEADFAADLAKATRRVERAS